MEESIDTNNTRLRILNILRNDGTSTKQGISQKLGINFTTISNLVNGLNIPGNYISVAGDDDSSGGRKPKLYTINNNAGYVIGIDIGGENLRFMITEICGNIISSYKQKNKPGSVNHCFYSVPALLLQQQTCPRFPEPRALSA